MTTVRNQSRRETKTGRRWRVLVGTLAVATGIFTPACANAQLTRDVTPAVASERLLLDSYLRQGRTVAGTRLNEGQFRQLYANRFPNPFLLVLREADRLRITDDQADSLAVLNRNYVHASDSTWGTVGRYLVALPEEFDIAAAWSHVSVGFKIMVPRLLAAVTAEKKVLTRDQLAALPPNVVSSLDSTCIHALDPTDPTVRIGGGGAMGLGRVRGC